MPPKRAAGRGGASHLSKPPRDYHAADPESAQASQAGSPSPSIGPPGPATAAPSRTSQSTIIPPAIPEWAQRGAAQAQPASPAPDPASRQAKQSYIPPPNPMNVYGSTPSVARAPAQGVRTPATATSAFRTTPIPLPSLVGPVTPRIPTIEPPGFGESPALSLSAEETQAQVASAAWTAQPTVLPPAALAKAKKRLGQNLPLNQLFPHFFYAPSKANCALLANIGPPGRLDYNPTSQSFEEEIDATPESLSASKNKTLVAGDRALTQLELYNLSKNLKICAFLYGVNWFTMWIVGNAIPEANTTPFFHKQRLYVMTNHQTTKHEFLFERLLPYTRKWCAIRENMSWMDADLDVEDSRAQLMQAIIDREMTSAMFEDVYSYVAVYIDFDKTFLPEDPQSDPMDHMPFYSLVTTHHAMFVAAIRICQAESDRNAENGLHPKDKLWEQDVQARQNLKSLFDSINLLDSLLEFDREDIVEKPIEQSMVRTKAKGPNMKVVNDNTVSNMRPPPPKKRRVLETTESTWDASTAAAQAASDPTAKHTVRATTQVQAVSKPTHTRRQTGTAAVGQQHKSSAVAKQPKSSASRPRARELELESVQEDTGYDFDRDYQPGDIGRMADAVAAQRREMDELDEEVDDFLGDGDEFAQRRRPRVPARGQQHPLLNTGRAANTTSASRRGQPPAYLTAVPTAPRNPMETRPDFNMDVEAQSPQSFQRSPTSYSEHDSQAENHPESFHRSPSKRPSVMHYQFEADSQAVIDPRIRSTQIDPMEYPMQYQTVRDLEIQQALAGASGAELGLVPESVYPPPPATQETYIAPPRVPRVPQPSPASQPVGLERNKRPAATASDAVAPRRSLRNASANLAETRAGISPVLSQPAVSQAALSQPGLSATGSLRRPTVASTQRAKQTGSKEPSPERPRGDDNPLSDSTDLFDLDDDEVEDDGYESPSLIVSVRSRHRKRQSSVSGQADLPIERDSEDSESDGEQADEPVFDQADLSTEQANKPVIEPVINQAVETADQADMMYDATESASEQADDQTHSKADPQR